MLVHYYSVWSHCVKEYRFPLKKTQLLSYNTHGTCRAPWPPEQPAPARWDRSCSICPWVYLRRRWSLRPAVVVVEAEPGGREALQAAPCSGRTATTFLQRINKAQFEPVLCGPRDGSCYRPVTLHFLHTRVTPHSPARAQLKV